QACIHGVARDPEAGRRMRDVPPRLLECRQQVLSLRLLTARCGPRRERGSGRPRVLRLQRAQTLCSEHRGIREQGSTLDDIRELADVAGPRIAEEMCLGAEIEALEWQPVLGAGASEEALGEEQDVTPALSQRGQLEGEHRKPVIEVLAEAMCADS